MEPVISVIVPVYKVEPYLPKCIESICRQTFSELEIILVDDGSPDCCGQICDEYAQTDPRIRVIHQENRGLSAARNAGMAIARGQYFGFVDSDDWIEPDMFAFLYHNLRKEQADISVCGMYQHDGGRVIPYGDPDFYGVQTPVEAIRSVLRHGQICFCVWNKLYRREVFSEIRFPEGRIYEDVFVMVRLLDQASRIVVQLAPKYHYLRRAGSITRSAYRPAMQDVIAAQQSNDQYLQTRHPELLPEVQFNLSAAHFAVLDAMLLSPQPVDADAKQVHLRYLRQHWAEILRNPHVSKRRKLILPMLCLHEKLYLWILKLVRR